MELINFNKFLAFLVTIFPILLISGPLIPEIILIIVSISINFQIIKKKEFNFYNSNIVYFFLFFWLYLIINSLFADDKIWSLKTSLFYFRYLIFSISIVYLVSNKFIKLNGILISLSLTFIFLIFDLYVQYTFGQNLFGQVAKDNRFSGIFGDELVLGSYIIKFYPLIVALIFLKINLFKKILILSTINPVIIISIILTGERTASILAFIFVLVSSFLIIDKIKNKIFYFISAVLIIFCIFHFNSNLKSRFIDDTLNYMIDSKYKQYTNIENISDGSEKIYIFSKIHHGHYTSAFKLFLEKPLFGHGVNSFRNSCKKFNHDFKCSTHPHNTMIQILSETGIIGFLFYFSIFIYLISSLIKSKSTSIKILSLGIVIYLFPFSPSGNFFNNWINMILYFLIAFYTYLMSSKIFSYDYKS